MQKRKLKAARKAAYRGVIPNTPMRFIVYISKPFLSPAFVVLLSVTLAQILSLVAPYILKIMVDAVTSADSREVILDNLAYWGLIYVCVNVIIFSFWRLSGFVGVYWLALSKAYSFTVLYDYLFHHSHAYYADRFAGAVANKVSHASDGADNLIEHMVYHYYPSLLSMIGTAALFLVTSLYVGLVFSALIVILLLLNIYMVRRRHPLIVAYAEASSLLRGIGVDLLTNIMAMRQYSRRDYERSHLLSYVDDRTKKDIKRDFSQEVGLLVNNVLVVLATIAIFVFTYYGIKSGEMTVGDMVLVLSLLWTSAYHMVFIGNMLNGFIRTYGEIEEGLEDILHNYDITDKAGAKKLEVTTGEVTWQNVTFDYGKNRVFETFNLTVPSGQRLGLVGPSGAGKTTFVSLLLRQHDITVGAISIDGQNIADVTQDSLRENIAVVPQEPLLFHRSIRENIAYGKPDATVEEIIEVAKKAQAHEFIGALEHGYDTLVGERGVKLSGGQKQRVAIARAMLKNAPILVLDEATSALDSESEVAIQKALHELMVGKTVVAIAHRLSTLREMDRLIVLENGRIVEDGTHETLVNSGGTYARLWAHQAGGFIAD